MAVIVQKKIGVGIRLQPIGESSILAHFSSLKSTFRSQTLSKEFEAYLAKHGLEPEEGVKFVDSSFDEANNSININNEEQEQSNALDASYSEEVRRLLRGESSDIMSTSMKVSYYSLYSLLLPLYPL